MRITSIKKEEGAKIVCRRLPGMRFADSGIKSQSCSHLVCVSFVKKEEQINMDLNKINEIAATGYTSKLKKSLHELPLNQYQTVPSLRILQGRFGQVPLVELNNFVVYLPGKATEVIIKNLENFTPGRYAIAYTGSEASSFGDNQVHHFKLKNLHE
ncbi:unnamed protein product [Acanthoscelides obtectus]|uniref:Uncharacterized protein n=1 Tax=Acanthoscelides obtectus TaxID=200917 RepID=A0A9P0MCQ9_ACAOB|nr:unnamed protein product [Acanthoscelides obtectus]CAK1652206.1 hypothetical protein AOBTE_LOCUS17733 [Acanthoscelides obtectus]